VSTLRWRWTSVLFLLCVAIGAAVAIVGLAAVMMTLVVDHRWIMYSVFIGLTLGGVPLLWRMIGRMTTSAWIGCALGLAGMIILVFAQSAEPTAAISDGRGYGATFVAGLAAASAMVLPGLSGAYLLLVLGQYETILGAVNDARDAASARDWAALFDLMHIFVPLALGVAAGIIAVSNIMKWLLRRFEKITLGVLLGLLLGAVLGLWPFRSGVEPQVGDTIKGVVVTEVTDIAEIKPRDWPVEYFTPTAGHIAAAIGLILLGMGMTYGVSRFGRDPDSASAPTDSSGSDSDSNADAR
jgi:putative membrane protein